MAGLAKWETTFNNPRAQGKSFSAPGGPRKAALLSGRKFFVSLSARGSIAHDVHSITHSENVFSTFISPIENQPQASARPPLPFWLQRSLGAILLSSMHPT